MTCILAIQNPKTMKAAIGCDGRISASTGIISEAAIKLLELNIGILGLSCETNIAVHVRRELRRGNEQPQHPEDVGAWIMDILRSGGWKFKEDPGQSLWADFSGVLVVNRTNFQELDLPLIYYVHGTGSCVRIEPGRPAACGCGGSEATGAALALATHQPVGLGRDASEWDPKDIVEQAIEIACRLDSGCGGAITVRSVE